LRDPADVVVAKRTRGDAAARVRRDPRDFARLLCAPVGGI
jgi:hypothetical protein